MRRGTQYGFQSDPPNHWSELAACRDDPDRQYPDEKDRRGIWFAKQVCAVCPVTEECLTDALERNELFGVWGGKTPVERRGIRRECKTCGATFHTPTRHKSRVRCYDCTPDYETRREDIRRLAGEGLSDPEIGERLGVSADVVGWTRKAHRIPPGRPRGGGMKR